jgi:hypothetical protein
MHDKVRDRKNKLIDAGYKAVDELIKVAGAKIIKFDNDDDLAAEKMKTAAQAKKIAIEDAFEILSRIQREEESLESGSSSESNKEVSFAESRARK